MVSTPLSLRAVALSILGLTAAVEARHVQRRNACKPSSSFTGLPSTTEDLPSSTATPSEESSAEITPTPTIATTSAAYCDPTSTFHPERCFVTLPTACIDLRLDFPTPWGAQEASFCQGAIQEMATLMPEATPCFSDQYAATFHPETAYSCLTSAIVCTSTTASCDPAVATASPTPLVANAGFETGDMTPYVMRPGYSASPANVAIAVTDEKAHSGSHSLKIVYKALDQYTVEYAQRGIKLVPGADYQLSWWWWSTTNVAETGMIFRLDYVDYQYSAVRVNTWIPAGQPVGTWVQSSFTYTAQASFSMLTLAFTATKGTGVQNVLYMDDIELTRL